MPLLNYTTTIAAEKTCTDITRQLAQAGAGQILTMYHDGRPTGLAFAMDTPVGTRQYRLPVNTSAVEKVLRSDRKVPTRFKTAEQAERVAWRILKDWVEAQLAIIETRMVSPDQVFLPYMLMGEHTVYDLYLTQQLALEVESDGCPTWFQSFCEMCGDPLDIRKAGVHEFTSGWVENRKGGGAHAIRMAQRSQRWACKFCVDKEMAGAARWQPSLFG